VTKLRVGRQRNLGPISEGARTFIFHVVAWATLNSTQLLIQWEQDSLPGSYAAGAGRWPLLFIIRLRGVIPSPKYVSMSWWLTGWLNTGTTVTDLTFTSHCGTLSRWIEWDCL
jgi:hypothetical protein